METIINRNIQMRSYARLAMELIKGALPDVDFHLMCASDNMPRQWREYSAFRVHECPDAVPPIGVVLDTKIRSPWEVPDLELYARRITDALIESVQLRAKALEVASAGRPTPLVILVGALLAINVAGRFTDLSGIAQPIQQSVEVGVIAEISHDSAVPDRV